MRSRIGLALAAAGVVVAAGYATAGLVAEARQGEEPPVATADALSRQPSGSAGRTGH